MITVLIDNIQKKYPVGITLLDICKDIYTNDYRRYVVAKVNNDLRDLQTEIITNSEINFISLDSDEGIKVYQRSLTFVLITAAKELFPNGELTVEHSLSKGLYCELHIGRTINEEDITNLKLYMQKIVDEDRPIIKMVVPKYEAISMFEASKQKEKISIIKNLKRDAVSIYYCGDMYDYFYGNMMPSTGYVNIFDVTIYSPGLILRFPEKENPSELPILIEQPKLSKIFFEAEQWGQIMHCDYVGALNNIIEEGNVRDLIRVAEAFHEKKLAQIADYISEHRKHVRLILVAGPSSSGKTTFAQRIRIQLRVNGVRPVPLSLDDYFIDRSRTPRDDKGDYDFEAIEAIDLELFNEHLSRMLAGEEVKIPSYNFMTGQREYRGHKIKLDDEQPLIIEGIHGLNERLTKSVAKERKVKIYISALTQLSIDNHNRIPTTDTRLIRRMVRDSQFRAHDALKTLQIWQSVRRGEERNIFPYQEEADIMFNSALLYELAVLKKYAEPLLEKIGPEDNVYSEAKRLLSFLAHFISVDDNDIPPNSILREFVGRSCFSER